MINSETEKLIKVPPKEYDQTLENFLLLNDIDIGNIWDIIGENWGGNGIINKQSIATFFEDYGAEISISEYLIYSTNRILQNYSPQVKCIFTLPLSYNGEDEICMFWSTRYSNDNIRKMVKLKAFL